MDLFKKRKKEVVDERTELEKTFEEKGQQIGKDTGGIVQKGIDKFNKIKEKYDADEKIDKVKDIADKAEHKVDDFIGKASKKGKEVIEKVKNK